MRYSGIQVVFQEVPDEVSLALHISGCPMRCRGCHSSELRNPEIGYDLNEKVLQELIAKYSSYISCVLFMGGEWEPLSLIKLLRLAKNFKLKTALYTGLDRDQVDQQIVANLDYLKYGPWAEQVGGLDSPQTNQRFVKLSTGECLNSRFQ